jgi:hypothetical protein
VWYLIAYDAADDTLKAYELKAIRNLRTLYENFVGNPKIEAELEARCDRRDPAWFV